MTTIHVCDDCHRILEPGEGCCIEHPNASLSSIRTKAIEITPEHNRRVLAERRREPRERVAELEARLREIEQLATEALESGARDEVDRLVKIVAVANVNLEYFK